MFVSAWKGLTPFLAHPKRQVAILIAVSVLVGITEAGVLVLVVHTALAIADKGRNTGTDLSIIQLHASSGVLLWIAAGLGVTSIAGHLLFSHLKAQASSEVMATARSVAIDAFMSASWNRQSKDREGALQETMSSIVTRLSTMAGYMVTGIASMINLLAFLTIAAVVNPVAMVVIMVFGFVLSIAMRPLTKITQRRSAQFIETNSRFVEEISRTTSLALEYRVFGVEHVARDDMQALTRETARRQYVTRLSGSFSETLYRDLAALFLVAALAGMYLAKDVSVASIGTVVVLIVRGLGYAQLVQSQFQYLSEELPNLDAFSERIRGFLDEPTTFGAEPIDEIATVEFVDVSYEYTAGLPALSEFSLVLNRGEVLGVVGPSGGGKSTFVQVLLRLRTPQIGTVLVNGKSYERYDQRAWALLVAVVPQEPRLMEATVAENIRFLRADIDRTDVQRAAADAHVDTDIAKLTNGFDTLLGPRGGGLSGGQKQRVAIARALVGKPKLLVLDEPTSALDTASERLLQETIASLKGSVTMVIVAHRLSTLDVCDRLLVVRDGRIEAIGTPAELAAQPGFYQSITSTLGTADGDLEVADTLT